MSCGRFTATAPARLQMHAAEGGDFLFLLYFTAHARFTRVDRETENVNIEELNVKT